MGTHLWSLKSNLQTHTYTSLNNIQFTHFCPSSSHFFYKPFSLLQTNTKYKFTHHCSTSSFVFFPMPTTAPETTQDSNSTANVAQSSSFVLPTMSVKTQTPALIHHSSSKTKISNVGQTQHQANNSDNNMLTDSSGSSTSSSTLHSQSSSPSQKQ